MADSEVKYGDLGHTIAEESFPDLLKNTPSNIARLEDVIEHSKGRQKYLAQTRSPSDGGDVRWYFSKVPLLETELAASYPRTDIVGKSDYFRFGMRDSLAIEASFLEREDELLSIWWKEYAECSEGPSERASSSKQLSSQPNASLLECSRLIQSYEVEEERVGVPVKGGLYEADLAKRHCFPVYWNGDNRRVLRGHWFARKGGLDWLPLRENVAEQLEVAYRRQVWHRRTFQPSGLFAARIDLQGSTPGLHALFTGEDDTWEAWLDIDVSGLSSFVRFGSNGIKLRRGYSASHSPKPTQEEIRQQKEEKMDDYCSQVPVRHLVFMVHGIGQRLEKSNLVDDVGNFRHITASLAERHLSLHQRGTQRVLFIPCQWRKGLKLSGETAVEKITLDGVRGLRVMLSATVHDVLYYMSPIYCQDIINSVSNQLNWLYSKFLKRNPGYDGKVSVYGHSLGSVISYDILCHQENLSSPFPMDWMYNEHVETTNMVDHTIDDTINAQVARKEQVERCVEDSSPYGGPVPADIYERSEMSLDFGRTDNDHSYQSVNESSNLLSQEDCPDVADYVNRGDKISVVEQIAEKRSNANENNLINNALREEIASLKVKLAELELQRGRRDIGDSLLQETKEVHTVNPKDPATEILPPNFDGAPDSYTTYIKYTKLEFKVDTFFAVGSPLGVFLALRNVRIGIGEGQLYWEEENINEEMPACRQMFNIFHPFDPVAYRIEPLVCKEYISNRPVIIPYHKGGKRFHIGFQEFSEDLAARSQAIMDRLSSVREKVLTACQSRNFDGREDGSENIEEREERSYGSMMMERLTGSAEGRVDHVLQDLTFKHPYLQAIGAHTNYWRDNDTALFILKHLYRNTPDEDQQMLDNTNRYNSKIKSESPSWRDQRETGSEELPLTFSDESMVRDLPRKAKQLTNKC